MKIDYQHLSLRPYGGEILLFRNLSWMKAKYTAMTGHPYTFSNDPTGGQFIRIDGKRKCDDVYLVYARHPHVLAHELAHVILIKFNEIGAHPVDGMGEPFCYMLSQLMLDAVKLKEVLTDEINPNRNAADI